MCSRFPFYEKVKDVWSFTYTSLCIRYAAMLTHQNSWSLPLDEARRKVTASRSTSGDSLALPTPLYISCSISKVLQ